MVNHNNPPTVALSSKKYAQPITLTATAHQFLGCFRVCEIQVHRLIEKVRIMLRTGRWYIPPLLTVGFFKPGYVNMFRGGKLLTRNDLKNDVTPKRKQPR